MIDYGAVVKKNGKIITDPEGDLFQNYSTLRYEKDADFNVIVNESEVTYHYTRYDYNWEGNRCIETNPRDESEQYSMCGNNYAVIGDKDALIGFYKCGFKIALDKVIDDRESNKSENKFYYVGDYFNDYKRKFKINSKIFRQFKVKRLDDRSDEAVYLARFYYKDDLYEVLFGYGIDPKPKYLYGKKSYHNAYTDYFDKTYHKNGKCKGLLRKIGKWYNN